MIASAFPVHPPGRRRRHLMYRAGMAFNLARQVMAEAHQIARQLGNEELIRRYHSFEVLLDNTISAAGGLLVGIDRIADSLDQAGAVPQKGGADGN